MDPLFGHVWSNNADIRGRTPWPTSHIGNSALTFLLTVDQRATAYSWGNYLARILEDLPQELRLASALKLEKQLLSHIFTSTFVTLAEKKVKRQCSSKRVMKSKATAELPKQDRE